MKRTPTSQGSAKGVVGLATTLMIVILMNFVTNVENKDIRHVCANPNRRIQLL